MKDPRCLYDHVIIYEKVTKEYKLWVSFNKLVCGPMGMKESHHDYPPFY